MIGDINLALIASLAVALLAVLGRIELRERRIVKIETAIDFLRRDLDQVLHMYHLVPTEEREKRRRR